MQEAVAAIQHFLDSFALLKTAQAFRSQAEALLRRNPKIQSSVKVDLVTILNKCVAEKAARERDRGMAPKGNQGNADFKKKIRLYTQQQTQNILQSMMNRMINSPKFMQDQKLNKKVEGLMKNKVFLKLVQATAGYGDISQINKNSQNSQSFVNQSGDLSEQRLPEQQQHKLKKSPSFRDIRKQQSLGSQQIKDQSLKVDVDKAPSMIHSEHFDQSEIISNPSAVQEILDEPQPEIDEYVGDDDPGFQVYQINQSQFKQVSKRIAQRYKYPASALMPESNTAPQKEEQTAVGKLPQHLKFPAHGDQFYPVQYEQIIYDCFNLKVIYNRQKTGFEDTKEFPILINSVIGGRYQQIQFLGSAAFSKAIEVLDIVTNKRYCMKIIENNKDYFDQSIDQIKLLKFINHNADVQEKRVLKVFDYFYYKEHLFIVTQLLKDNLYEAYKQCRQLSLPNYFTMGRIQKVCLQVLIALDYIHSLKLIHTDLKPENILLEDKEAATIKVIDFGSSIFTHDRLSPYIQTRSYRAPQVILGLKYDSKIDIWSLGCIAAELLSCNVLFHNDSIQGYLARVSSIVGPWPEWMLKQGKLVSNFMTRQKLIYHQVFQDGEASHNVYENSELADRRRRTGFIQIFVPKRTTLQARLKTEDAYFLDFVKSLLQLDPSKRPTAREAMEHPFIKQAVYEDGLIHD